MQNLEEWVRENDTIDRVKAVVGVRGIRKAQALTSIFERNILHLDFENPRFRHIKTADDALEIISEHEGRMPRRIMLDEPGRVSEHTRLIRTLYESGKWNVYVVSSCKHVLDEANRSWTKNPIVEYRAWHRLMQNRRLPNLECVWFKIYVFDVADGLDAASVRRFRAMVEYYSDHVGDVITNRALAARLRFYGNMSCATIIGKYRKRLEDAYLIEFADCYNCFEKTVVKNVPKVFFTDLELRNYVFGDAPEDEERRSALNNLYLRLRRDYEKVYYPKDRPDADFVTLDDRGRFKFWSL